MSEPEKRSPRHSAPENAVRVRITVEREFLMDADRILGRSDFDPPGSTAEPDEVQKWLKESFYELCGYDREEDHVDGSYVWLVKEDSDADFDWPEELK